MSLFEDFLSTGTYPFGMYVLFFTSVIVIPCFENIFEITTVKFKLCHTYFSETEFIKFLVFYYNH